MVVTIETLDSRDRLRRRGCDAKEPPVKLTHIASGADLVFNEGEERRPKRPLRGIHEHNGCGRGLSVLEQRQQFKDLIEGPEAPRKRHESFALLRQRYLSREEVAHFHEFAVRGDELVRALFVRKLDVDPEAIFSARPFHSCRHDAGPCSGHDHPPAFGDGLSELPSEFVEGIRGWRSRRAKNSHLECLAVGGEHIKRLHEFAECRFRDLQIEGIGILFR